VLLGRDAAAGREGAQLLDAGGDGVAVDDAGGGADGQGEGEPEPSRMSRKLEGSGLFLHHLQGPAQVGCVGD
jgi:hypothetical protein